MVLAFFPKSDHQHNFSTWSNHCLTLYNTIFWSLKTSPLWYVFLPCLSPHYPFYSLKWPRALRETWQEAGYFKNWRCAFLPWDSPLWFTHGCMLGILDWCVTWAGKFRLTSVMQCSVTKKSVRVIFASQFQNSLLCVFWKGKFPPVALSSARRLLNPIQQDHCRVAVLNTHEVSFTLFLCLEICLGCLWNNVYFNTLSLELKQ